MLTDQLNDWKNQVEAAEILKCSEKTVGRMAAQKKIERVLRRVPGRKPMPVFNPDDIEAIRDKGLSALLACTVVSDPPWAGTEVFTTGNAMLGFPVRCWSLA